jgi:hypothetical protein
MEGRNIVNKDIIAPGRYIPPAPARQPLLASLCFLIPSPVPKTQYHTHRQHIDSRSFTVPVTTLKLGTCPTTLENLVSALSISIPSLHFFILRGRKVQARKYPMSEGLITRWA